jgi:hypothetical protein
VQGVPYHATTFKVCRLNIERLHDLLDDDGRISFMGHCHDCGVECTVSARALEDGIEIEGGAVYEPLEPLMHYIKCDACYSKNRTLSDYQDCEVYARVVGYLRPVKQFNEAKQAEFRDRVNFKVGV